jgi:hypothetical protein
MDKNQDDTCGCGWPRVTQSVQGKGKSSDPRLAETGEWPALKLEAFDMPESTVEEPPPDGGDEENPVPAPRD